MIDISDLIDDVDPDEVDFNFVAEMFYNFEGRMIKVSDLPDGVL